MIEAYANLEWLFMKSRLSTFFNYPITNKLLPSGLNFECPFIKFSASYTVTFQQLSIDHPCLPSAGNSILGAIGPKFYFRSYKYSELCGFNALQCNIEHPCLDPF